MCELSHIRMAQAERERLALRWKEIHGEPLPREVSTDLAAQIVGICDKLDYCEKLVTETNHLLRASA